MIKDLLRDIGRTAPPGTTPVLRGDRIFFLHPFKRFDPITLAIMAVGVGIQVAGTLQEGKDAERIAKARADVDIQNAEAARRASVEKAKIKGEKGRRLIETQKGAAAAGGIRINVGAPLVIEAQTRADIATDIGFVLESGRTEADFFRSSAAIELATGKAARKKSKFDALSQGLLGFGSIAFKGADAGLFSSTSGVPAGLPKVGTVTPGAGAAFARF